MARYWSPRRVVECVKLCGWWGVRVRSTTRKPCPWCGARVRLVPEDRITGNQRDKCDRANR